MAHRPLQTSDATVRHADAAALSARLSPLARAVVGGIRARHRRVALIIGLLVALALGEGIMSTGIGPVPIDPLTVLQVVSRHLIGQPHEATWSGAVDAIVWITRLPRVLMAIAVGSVLAMAGVVLQAIVRNGLADPYILGVSSGASTGAAFAITVLGGYGGMLVLPASAFAGALGSVLLVLLIGGRAAQSTPFRLILAGMAIGYALSSVTSFLVFASDSPEASRSVMFWLLGSLANVHWPLVWLSLCVAAIAVVALMLSAGRLDAMAAGDDTALSLGVHPGRTRLGLMVGVSLVVAVMVAGAGSIGFVGLIVPHMARALVGTRHRVLLPASALLGATFLLLADIAARMLFPPTEMAIGVVTGVVGAPLMLILLRKGGRHTF